MSGCYKCLHCGQLLQVLNENFSITDKILCFDFYAFRVGSTDLPNVALHIINLKGLPAHGNLAFEKSKIAQGRVGVLLSVHLQVLEDGKGKFRFSEEHIATRFVNTKKD